MSVGNRIREFREKKHINGKPLTLRKLARLANISPSFLSDVEREAAFPSLETLKKIAEALECHPSELLENLGPRFPRVARPFNIVEWYDVPLLDPSVIVCAGSGNGGMEGIQIESCQTICLPREWCGIISQDVDKQPFAVKVEGDSMAGAGIPSGAEIVINPAEEVREGDAALVCFGTRGDWAIKWVHFNRDGSIELRASSPNTPTKIFPKDDISLGFLKIIGRVMRSTSTPKRNV